MMDYCSKEYKFWQKAYIPVVWFLYKDTDKQMSAIGSQIIENIDGIKNYVEWLSKILSQRDESEVVRVNVFEIGLKKLIKNKKEYWTGIPRNRKIEIGANDGPIGWIGKFYKSPKLYDILVVVATEVVGEPVFDLGKVFFLKSSDNMEKIEEFMYFSDQIVEPRSMYSAIYDVKKVFNFDVKTGKLYKSKIEKIDDEELMD